jgi:hypothetical protein
MTDVATIERSIVIDAPAAAIGIDLAFTAPFRSTSTVAYRLTETGATTEVVWSMTTPQNLMAKVMGIFVNMDKMLGRDFEKGLAQLKAVVESEHHTD